VRRDDSLLNVIALPRTTSAELSSPSKNREQRTERETPDECTVVLDCAFEALGVW
jgi:hypothetical protein